MEEIKNMLTSLEGNSIGEKLKNLNKLIEYINDSGYTESAHLIINAYNPINDFEKLVKLRLIDSFKYAEGVVNIAKSGDLFYIPWILKFKWFFSDEPGLLNNLSDFGSFLPFLSYSSRLKFLKKYSVHLKNCQKGEALYSFLIKIYGCNLALLVLPACSDNFVRSVLFSSEILAPQDICSALFDRYPDLIVQYFRFLLMKRPNEEDHERNRRAYSLSNYENVFKKLASRQTKSFIELLEDFNEIKSFVKFGKHIAKKFVKKESDAVCRLSSQFLEIIQMKHVSQMMPVAQLEILHLNMIPNSLSEFTKKSFFFYSKPNHYEILMKLKRHYQQDILCKNFQKKYNENLLELVKEWDKDFAALLPMNGREKWVDLMIRKDYKNEASYVCFLSTEKAIPRLKEMIKKENDMGSRASLIEYMFKNLKLNGKIDEGHDLCSYCVKKFRNDNICVRENVLKGLIGLDLEKSLQHSWDSELELIQIFDLNNETSSVIRDIIVLIQKWIHNRLANNLSAMYQLNFLLNTIKDEFDYIVAHNTIYEKDCLLWFCDNLLNKKFENDMARLSLVKALFSAIYKWNNNHKKDKLNFPQWLLAEIETILLGKKNHYLKLEIMSVLRSDETLKSMMYGSLYPKLITPSIMNYILQDDYNNIVVNINEVVEHIIEQDIQEYKLILKKLRLLPWTHISEKMISICKEIESNSSPKVKDNKICLLSILMEVTDFIQFISPYLPSEQIIKEYSDCEKNRYSIISSVGLNLKNLTKPLLLLPPLKKMAVGDYLKLVVGSLESICLRTPEFEILNYLKEWINCPVSLRKHLVRCYCKIAPVELASSFLFELFQQEKNISLRIVYFNQVFSIFKSNPNQDAWTLLQGILGLLKPMDNKVVESLLNMPIPKEFKSDFIENVWDIIHKMDFKEDQVTDFESCIIGLIDFSLINIISNDFCDTIISNLYTNLNKDLEGGESRSASYKTNMNNFTIIYLIYSTSQEVQSIRLSKVKQAIDQLVKKHWGKLNFNGGPVCEARELLEDLIISLSNKVCSLKSLPLDPCQLMEELNIFLLKNLPEEDIFRGLVSLKLAILFHKSKRFGEGQHFAQFFALVRKFIHDSCEQHHDGAIVFIISEEIANVFSWFDEPLHGLKRLTACEILLENPESKYSQIVALELLPKTLSMVEEYKCDYTRVMNIVREIKDFSVKIFANRYYMTLHEN